MIDGRESAKNRTANWGPIRPSDGQGCRLIGFASLWLFDIVIRLTRSTAQYDSSGVDYTSSGVVVGSTVRLITDIIINASEYVTWCSVTIAINTAIR